MQPPLMSRKPDKIKWAFLALAAFITFSTFFTLQAQTAPDRKFESQSAVRSLLEVG